MTFNAVFYTVSSIGTLTMTVKRLAFMIFLKKKLFFMNKKALSFSIHFPEFT